MFAGFFFALDQRRAGRRYFLLCIRKGRLWGMLYTGGLNIRELWAFGAAKQTVLQDEKMYGDCDV